MEQGSSAWLTKRKECITASDIPTIMGISSYGKTARDLWMQKKDLVPADEMNIAMEHGIRTEPMARMCLNKLTGIKFQPQVLFHPDHPHFMASLDGLDYSGTRACEIKCPYNIKNYHAALQRKGPAQDHYAQMQWQMYVGKLKHIIYFVYWSDIGFYITECKRNEDFIREAVEAANQFYDWMVNNIEPPDEYWHLEESVEADRIQRAIQLKEIIKDSERELDEIKNYYLEKSDFQSVKCGPLCIRIQETKGSIDYKSIPEIQNIDLDQYRKPSYTKYVMTIKKED
ncbi:MAG: YqaJ viral recombinase family protein [Ignavibacteria bacterium]|jgi:putative phage-type endonuclease